MDLKNQIKKQVERHKREPLIGTHIRETIQHIRAVMHGRKKCSVDCSRCLEFGLDGSRTLDIN